MKHPLTIAYITSREHCEFKWFFDSLELQLKPEDDARIVIVDALHNERPRPFQPMAVESVTRTLPKPNVWQGSHRLTKEDWWANSNARNTGICLCTTPWIAFLDDRCVLMPGWIEGIRKAMEGEYVVAGAYEKRISMTVEGGVIQNGGVVIGKDPREAHCDKYWPSSEPMVCGGEWLFGCSLAMPLNWALEVNGYDETCDGIGMEDCIFGLHLRNSGFVIKYDRTMKMIEDRTPELMLKPMRREDKGVSPNDKSHAMLNKLRNLNAAVHPINLREIRRSVLAGNQWPAAWGPVKDWYDDQPISEF